MPDPIGGVQPFAELARGEATTVYKGYRQADRRLVLLKTVRPDERAGEDRFERFDAEAQIAAQVHHPNVVSVLDSGREGGTAYLITEFVEGLDLRALLDWGPLPPELAAYVLHEAAQGLAAVHAQGIVHRDLKPANILVSAEGAVKLTDFGLASLAPTDAAGHAAEHIEVRGTLGYLAPELVRGDPPTSSSDLFSLGVVFAEMLTGRAVFSQSGTSDTLDAVLHVDPAPALAADPRIPPSFADLAANLLQKAPQQRLSSADAVTGALASLRAQFPATADDVARYLGDPNAYQPTPLAGTAIPVAASSSDESETDGAAERPASPRRRMRWKVAAGVLAVALLAVIGAALVTERPSDSPSTEQSQPAISESVAESEETETPIPPDSAQSVSVVRSPPDTSTPSPQPVSEPEEERIAEVSAEPENSEPASADEQQVDTEADPVPDLADPTGETATPTGTLVVVAEPWARVRVDGVDIGTTPLEALTLPAGRHTVSFENPDFPPYSIEVSVVSGGRERLAVSLWDLVGRVTLLVSPWADVAVDGTYWDTVPPQERPLVLVPGTHRITFVHPALGTRETTLRIAAGESRTIRINLNEGGS